MWKNAGLRSRSLKRWSGEAVPQLQDRKLAFNTLEGYRIDLASAAEFFGCTAVAQMNRGDVQDYVNWLERQKIVTGKHQGDRLSVRTVKVRVKALGRLLNWLESNEVLSAGRSLITRDLDYRKEQPKLL